MIDAEGYRANVGIILCNRSSQLLWARRIGQDAWQFPQGGIAENETPEAAMYRELREEVGLLPEDVSLVARTRDWLRYRLPRRMIRRHSRPLCIGQKQIWFMLKLVGDENRVRFDFTDHPEFDRWRWIDYWGPLREVVAFKRRVYRQALQEFAPYVLPDRQPPRQPRAGAAR
ncbi:MAG TPA: RNA pyrophosphohydrolase [Gammaproteobacteria bacterium]|nr:RNA pyrophosphohydrolase [Gammaproteobacteria bacterium]